MHEDRFADFLSWGHGAGFALYFVALWSVICYSISWFSGWHRLAQQFRCERSFEGERWRFRSGLMRWNTRFGGALMLGANREGFFIAVLFLFRIGQPPLFIPWSEITIRQRQWWAMSQTGFVLGSEAQIPLWVRKKLGDQILAYRPEGVGGGENVYSRAGLDDPRTSV